MANLKQGMSGSEVEKLQNALIDAGYDVGKTGADGIFGKNTLAAVKQYQKDNGLTVDGIAGKNTLGKLYSTSGSTTTNTSTGTASTGSTAKTTTASTGSNTSNATASTAATTNTTTPATTDQGFTYEEFTYDPFTYDEFNVQDNAVIQQAEALLQQQIASKPGEWVDPYKDTYMGYLSQYENRDPFSYDFNSDALYNQYKDQYILQGQMAMMDTMGQAAALTGGYGNSYAQTAGQMAYNQQLNNLNDIIPELYSMAYDRYNQEGQDLLNMYNAYLGLSEQDYNKYQDKLSNWYTMLDYYTDNYNTVYDREYSTWLDETNLDLDNWKTQTGLDFDKWSAETGIDQTEYWNKIYQEYEEKRDEIADNQWQQEFDQNEAAIASDKQSANYNNLVDLITSTGYTPTAAELNAAGMTDTQAQAYKNYYDSAQTTGGSGGSEYTDLEVGSTAYNIITKAINGATDLDDLALITSEYIRLYGEDAIKGLYAFQKKLAELTPKDGGGGGGSTGGGGSGYGGSRSAYAVRLTE